MLRASDSSSLLLAILLAITNDLRWPVSFLARTQISRRNDGRCGRRQNGARLAVHDVRVHAHVRRQSR